LLCDSAEKIVRSELCHLYYWSERDERPLLRLCHPRRPLNCPHHRHMSRFNVWAIQYGRPLLITRGIDDDADAELDTLGVSSALVMPLFVRSRVAGSLQLFSTRAAAFTHQDAQMLWLLVLAAENLLTREEANEGLLHFAFTDFLTGLH